ncbi:hypothetical protein B808_729 [Fructilactobacillus florum 8D]|uniref:Uncharacterized protein n=2 Tax=Fructilactobacillus florum TaxID=640331 RepID=W9EE43_9LACO|nr:hypothetical protein [Fructilactobacillus florum]EKK20376.1 hypothetical protein B807_832 [Fructilactobacillus florum 2F]ETO40378.1 hypothetical protein B808_729 [Fructilactobacillus florum 8D]KRM92347.1 hypothetical protein FC87_GL000480 [Fructilactobacillus florum DSM 22689 = JCM 16035]
MDDDQRWLVTTLDQLLSKTNNFADRALLEATKAAVLEQSQRLAQAQDELDGRSWSPANW